MAVGAKDSPQATLIPLAHLAGEGLEPGADFEVVPFDMLAGKHGDHIGGEREAVRALIRGEADAACMIDANHLAFIREGHASLRRHAHPGAHRRLRSLQLHRARRCAAGLVKRFRELLLGMSYADAEVRPLLDLEGLKQWLPGRTEGYKAAGGGGGSLRHDRFVRRQRSGAMQVDLGDLGFDEGGHLLVKRGAAAARSRCEVARHGARAGDRICAPGAAPKATLSSGERATRLIRRGGAETGAGRVRNARAARMRAVEHRPRTWGLAARGARVEAGAPEFDFRLVDKIEVWSDDAARIYAQAAAAQWDPETAIPWDAAFELPDEVEDAVVQIMTYLIENETAALIIPSRFIAQMHPHFREVMQVLAMQAADEARHIEVFTRRALLKRGELGSFDHRRTGVAEDAGGRARFRDRLVSAVGARRGHVPVAAVVHRAVCARSGDGGGGAAGGAGRSAARGVRPGAPARSTSMRDPDLRPRLADAVHRRHDALRHTAGLNAEVFDALLLMAAGSWSRTICAAETSASRPCCATWMRRGACAWRGWDLTSARRRKSRRFTRGISCKDTGSGMAGFWDNITRFEPHKVTPWVGLRNALGVVLPLAAGAIMGTIPSGLVMATGALNVSFSDSHDPYIQRARRMLAASVVVGMGVFAGAFAGAIPASSSW